MAKHHHAGGRRQKTQEAVRLAYQRAKTWREISQATGSERDVLLAEASGISGQLGAVIIGVTADRASRRKTVAAESARATEMVDTTPPAQAPTATSYESIDARYARQLVQPEPEHGPQQTVQVARATGRSAVVAFVEI